MIKSLLSQLSKHLKIKVLLVFAIASAVTVESVASDDSEEFNPGEMINHHIMDSHVWEIWHGMNVYLPVIIYSEEKGIESFSSANFFDADHNAIPYNGYVMDHDHITLASGDHVLDFSITKNVLFLFIDAGLLLLIFFAVARGYKKNVGKAPKGIQSFFEPIIIFVRDEIVKPNIGPKYERYLPYMLTLFFFIWFGNLLGLLPGAANLTGNIAVTLVLALLTLVITTFSGNKNYWGHIFNTPGVPFALKPIIVPVEIIGIFTKPISLMIRLFVAITAGHIVILSLLSLTFIFHSYLVGIGSTLVVTFINFIELLVATIQAYVFTMFSSLYIGMAVEEHH
ncbi:MAG: F0F1 ATP synthase subunit A [Cyclobacteriaceae bacterium]|nr:F0F1 ATP synthase subunit A [Cyclobacteriaceae bacterium HetDA_MAG_MS6]